MFDRFTDRARKVMALANEQAQRFNHKYIGTGHILLGLVKEGWGVGAYILRSFGIDLRRVQADVESLVQRGADPCVRDKLPQTPRATRVIEYAIREARDLGHGYVGTEHVLLGLLCEGEGLAAKVLVQLGATLERVRPAVRTHLEKPSGPAQGDVRGNGAVTSRAGASLFGAFTDRARRVMALANQESQRLNHEYIGTEHILLGLVMEGNGVGAYVLKIHGLELERVRTKIEEMQRAGPVTITMGRFPQTPRAKRCIEFAIAESRSLGHRHVGTEHLLLGVMNEPDSVACQVLMNLGVSPASARDTVVALRGQDGNAGESARTRISPPLDLLVLPADMTFAEPFRDHPAVKAFIAWLLQTALRLQLASEINPPSPAAPEARDFLRDTFKRGVALLKEICERLDDEKQGNEHRP